MRELQALHRASGLLECDAARALAWFGLAKAHIGLYVRPPVIEEHKSELEGYGTTKSAVHLPLDKKLPIALIKKLVKARMKINEATELSNDKFGYFLYGYITILDF